MTAQSVNFRFLAQHDPMLEALGGRAERYFAEEPADCLYKLRQLAEALAKHTAASFGVFDPDENFADRLRTLSYNNVLSREISDLFHGLRISGNSAVHHFQGTHSQALHQLRMARELGLWFHRTFKDPKYKAGPFLPPPDPKKAQAVSEEIERLRKKVQEAEAAAAQAEAKAVKSAEELAEIWSLAHETEEELLAAQALLEEQEAKLATDLAKTQEEAKAAPKEAVATQVQAAAAASSLLDLDEPATRRLIDQQLRDAGWEVDSDEIRFAHGARPVKGKNLAIAEWKCESGPADYILFCGLTAVAVVEAKRKNKDVSGAISQAKRYSKGYQTHDASLVSGPWGKYRVPFLYSTNGRPYLRQLETKSGIWFFDARKSTNHPRALEGWHRPEELKAILKQDREAAAKKLEEEPFDYLQERLISRYYQREAIESVEAALNAGKREILIAAATGTGKTRLSIGLLYRLVKANYFRRILFLVDRRSLGTQAHDEGFAALKIEQGKSFVDCYDVKKLGDIEIDDETRLHFATVQSMVKRIMYGEPDEVPSVGQYDCIVIDEAHRGYNLDKDMTEAELEFRDLREYVSSYRRVLDHFDAVKIGLTATPALHTREIFGDPVNGPCDEKGRHLGYTYRQAVIDGYLVDHEPPIRIVTKLAESGIKWEAGEEIHYVDSKAPDQIQLFEAPDEVNIDIEGFNTRVHTEGFNRAVCETLAKHIDPFLEEKTLVFCATDDHADIVVKVLKEALEEAYGEIDDDLVMKITGVPKTDRPLKKLKLFKNEEQPKIVVTVDYLSTGIDVPRIANLVFLRRVRSRILYEQMLGRATRLCPEIGKESFRIFDAVDLYSALEDHTAMKPVVANPKVTFQKLIEEITNVTKSEARREFFDQLLAKLQRKKRRITGQVAEDFATLAKTDVETALQTLQTSTPAAAAKWFAERPDLAEFLDKATGDGRRVLISTKADETVRTERGYGNATKPEDYLEGFKSYLQQNQDKLTALSVVTQKPRDLTRTQLRELSLQLRDAGYSETSLRTAWREMTNADIAADVVGFIRMELLDSPLLSFEERVDRAIKRMLTRQAWTQPQRRWLERIGKQIKQERVVDHEALERGQFKAQGGFNRINKVFEGKLDELLKDIQETIWEDTAA